MLLGISGSEKREELAGVRGIRKRGDTLPCRMYDSVIEM